MHRQGVLCVLVCLPACLSACLCLFVRLQFVIPSVTSILPSVQWQLRLPVNAVTPRADTHRLFLESRLHLHESVLAEKKSVAHVDSSVDPASMSMESPDQALFSMDHPAPMDHPRLAPGGVMSIARDDNALSAAQLEGPVSGDWTPVRKAIFDAGETGKHMKAMNDRTNECTTDGNDVKTQKEVKAIKSANAAEADENDHNEDIQPQIEAKAPSRNKVVPFFRPKVPRSQA